MGDVFLRPMMDRLNSSRGPVSTIYGILPAITLATGERSKKNFCFLSMKCLGPIATIFTNKYGCRKVTIIGASLAASGFLASFFWANIWFYYLTIGIIGGKCLKEVGYELSISFFNRHWFWFNLFTSYCFCWCLF
jgi:hypothetical protein